ncbi:hypothetical protein WDU94_011960 [Cyamophila willieti]
METKRRMNPSVLIVLSSIVILASCAGAPPKSYYNRRAFPPQKYFYGHKGGYNPGPPITKYRPPGFRATRNPYIGPGPGAGVHHREVPQGPPQSIYPGPPQAFYQGVSQGIPHGIQQGVPQVMPQGIHQGVPQALHQPIPQFVPQGITQSGHPGQQQVLHQPVPQAIHQNVRILQPQAGPHPGHTHQLIPQQSQLIQSPSTKRFTPTPPPHAKTVAIPQFTSAAPYKSQPSHLNSIKNDFINEAPPSFTASTKAYYKPNDERSPIHTIPAPNLSPADKPADFDYRVQQQAHEQAAQKQAIQQRAAQQQALEQQAAQQQAAQQQAIQQQSTQQQYPSTPSFKTLDKAITQQIKINPAAYLAQQTSTHYAPDPDPLNAPRLPPTNDPFSQPSNGQLPIDIYLQQQLDNEIAQQESLYIQQQKAQEAIQYQQQMEAAQVLAAQHQAYQAHQENLNQQLLQQQALEVQQQLALQAQQHALLQQQAVLQQQQYEQAVSSQQQQPSESLTAEELYNLMNGIPPAQQVSTPSIQNVLATPQQNEIAGVATTNFQPNYQSFNYDEKAHQQQRQVEQTNNFQGNELKRATSEGTAQTNFSPQYQNFNYDEKTKRNGFNNEGNGIEQQTKIDDSVENTSKGESIEKKEKRFQKNAFVANQGYTVGYSTLPKEITDNVPQIQYNNHQQSGHSTAPGNYREKLNLPPSRRVKPDGVNEIKKTPHFKKKANKLPNNGYSTIAEDLLQQHDLKKDLQQLTYSTLPNKKILEVLKHQRHFNSSQQVQQPQVITTEKDPVLKMRENAQKFYNPHILQAVRNNTSNENVQIQQSIQIYENNYASKGDDNYIDLSGITTTSTTTAASPTSSTAASTTTEPAVATEINVIESNSNSDNDHQESNLYEEIMLQDESKPLEDSYHSNSHSYFGQRIRPKRT